MVNENPRLTAFIDAELAQRNLRLSSRMPQDKRLERMIEMVCYHKGVKANSMDIEVLSALILMAFGIHEKPEQWTLSVMETLPTRPIEQPIVHPMTRRSQIVKK